METDPLSAKIAPLVDLEELKTWILHEDEDLLVLNKPGWLVCHPSKNGPFSSLIGACREYLGVDRLHIISRLDRETSGLVVLAKNGKTASLYQKAIQDRLVTKKYIAIMHGNIKEKMEIKGALGQDTESAVYVKQKVSNAVDAKSAWTTFTPISSNKDFTLCLVDLHTGRKHQIRAHAQWAQHNIVGDKIYGPDERLYLEFIEQGWSDKMEKALLLKRQALHCYSLHFKFLAEPQVTFSAPLTEDLELFCKAQQLFYNEEDIK